MSKSATVPLRLLTPSAVEWKPHGYQEKARDFLIENGAAALFADPGTGKTSASLSAFAALLEAGVAKRALVIAPRRVCQLVWWQESQKWSQFRHLHFAWLHNSRAPWDIAGRPRKKEDELRRDADIYLINPEGISWLYKTYYDHQQRKPIGFPFDTVIVDELTKFKKATSQRSKFLRKLTPKTPRVWGLTGSPTPNGYEDLFGQMLLLDGGVALGEWYTKFRDKYFRAGFTGFDYELTPGADKRIEKRIEHMVLRISADDFLDYPGVLDDPIHIKLDDKARKAYDEMKKEMLLSVDDGIVTAANAAALYSKLAQLANGAVYLEQELSGKKQYTELHDAKLEALGDLVEQLGGQQLLVGYEFNHDLERICAYFKKRFKVDLPHLGKGTTDRQVAEIEKGWNAGQIPVLPCHPASAGHGLNFQEGGANHVCWFSATWDFELYDQFIRRIRRQGNTAKHVINHLLLVEDSIDGLKYDALQDKDETQERFLQAINTAFTGSPAAGVSAAKPQEMKMGLKKLGAKKAATAPAPAQQEETTQSKRPPSWGTPAMQADAAGEGQVNEDEQRRAIEAKLRGVSAQAQEDTGALVDAKAAFSGNVQAQLDGGTESDAEEKPKTKRKRATKKKAETAEAPELPRTNRHLEVEIKYEDGPVPTIRSSIGGDFDEDEAVRTAELVLAALMRVADELGE